MRVMRYVSGPMVPTSGASGSQEVVAILLVLAVVLAMAKGLGELFLRLGQPPVVGGLIAGVMLGPTFLHLVAAPIEGVGASEKAVGMPAELGLRGVPRA